MDPAVGGEPAVALRGVGKRYRQYVDTPLLITALRHLRTSGRADIWALRNIDLTIGQGQCVGLIGRNGSGKSTALRLIAGVTDVTEGDVDVRGRVAPLLSVGVGFHPELTGRENVYVNGQILGLGRTQIDRRLDAIIDFAEIEPFIDTAVKFYSSGMFVRLGFAVAVETRPDVLLVDEVLAVGDLAFQLKSFDRIEEIRKTGATVVLVSHNVSAIQRICGRVVVLDNGHVTYDGEPATGVAAYYETLMADLRVHDQGDESSHLVVEGFDLLDADGASARHIGTGESFTLRVTARCERAVAEPVFGFTVASDNGVPVYGRSVPSAPGVTYAAGERVSCELRARATLSGGQYSAFANIRSRDLSAVLDRTRPLLFAVDGPRQRSGIAELAVRVREVDRRS